LVGSGSGGNAAPLPDGTIRELPKKLAEGNAPRARREHRFSGFL
jgi:hypothetical protein